MKRTCKCGKMTSLRADGSLQRHKCPHGVWCACDMVPRCAACQTKWEGLQDKGLVECAFCLEKVRLYHHDKYGEIKAPHNCSHGMVCRPDASYLWTRPMPLAACSQCKQRVFDRLVEEEVQTRLAQASPPPPPPAARIERPNLRSADTEQLAYHVQHKGPWAVPVLRSGEGTLHDYVTVLVLLNADKLSREDVGVGARAMVEPIGSLAELITAIARAHDPSAF